MTHTEMIDRVFACMESDLKDKLDKYRDCISDFLGRENLGPDDLRRWTEFAFATYLKEHAETRLAELANVIDTVNFLNQAGK